MRLSPFHTRCRNILIQRWQAVLERDDISLDILANSSGIIRNLLRAPKGKSSSFRFFLPTQLLAKQADPTRDSHAFQLREGDGHTFNARDVAKHVVVPLNRQNGSPLGSSGDPYVNNPLRLPGLSPQYREQQADKLLWDSLCEIMDGVETNDDPEYVCSLLDQVLLEMRRLIEELTIQYAVPQRISHPVLMEHIREYLIPKTGGRRLHAVCIALLRTSGIIGAYMTRLAAERLTLPTRLAGDRRI